MRIELQSRADLPAETLNQLDDTYSTILMHVVSSGDTEAARWLLERRNLDANVETDLGWTALMQAVLIGKP